MSPLFWLFLMESATSCVIFVHLWQSLLLLGKCSAFLLVVYFCPALQDNLQAKSALAHVIFGGGDILCFCRVQMLSCQLGYIVKREFREMRFIFHVNTRLYVTGLICFNLASLKQGWQDPCVLAAGDVLYLLNHCSCLYFGNCRRESFFEPGGPDLKKQYAVSGVTNSIPKNPGLTAASQLSGTDLRALFHQGCQHLPMRVTEP